jgi:hypothetical protein
VAFLNGKATTRLIVLYAPEAKTLYRGLRLKRFDAASRMALESSGVAHRDGLSWWRQLWMVKRSRRPASDAAVLYARHGNRSRLAA